jgi:hypothetical protein
MKNKIQKFPKIQQVLTKNDNKSKLAAQLAN